MGWYWGEVLVASTIRLREAKNLASLFSNRKIGKREVVRKITIESKTRQNLTPHNLENALPSGK
jgi:hypothetical protein